MEPVINCGFVHTEPSVKIKPPEERDCGFSGAGSTKPSQAVDRPAPEKGGEVEPDDEAPTAASKRKK
jgi:hypothetical protein